MGTLLQKCEGLNTHHFQDSQSFLGTKDYSSKCFVWKDTVVFAAVMDPLEGVGGV